MRILLILILISVFGILASGQGKREVASLQLSFEIEDKNFCFGDSINIIAKITNISKKPLVIDVNRIGSVKYFDRYFSKTKKDLYGSFGQDEIPSSSYKADFIILQPRESYIKNLEIIFDNETFTRAGNYQMQIGYNQRIETKFKNIDVWNGLVNSNKVFISLKKCTK